MNSYDNQATFPPSAPTAPGATLTLPQPSGDPETPGGAPPSTHQVVFVQVPRMKRSFEHYSGRWAYMLGWVQMGAGVMSIILGIANPLTCGLYGMVGIGIWGGALVSNKGFRRDLKGDKRFRQQAHLPKLNLYFPGVRLYL